MASTLRSVALPTEHGGWSLTLEPVLLGLIVQPGWAGAALGGVALVGFLARTPAKIALVDRLRSRRLARTGLAERVAVAELVVLAVLLAGAFVAAEQPFWLPLLLALPLLAVELWYDVRSRSRRLVPELAGTVAVSGIAAAIILAGGGDGLTAAGAWCVAGGRALAAIPFVRVQLRRAKDQPFRRRESDAAQVVAVVVVALGLAVDAVPVAGLIAIVGLAVIHAVLSRRPVPAVPVLGAQQVVLGLTVVLVAGLGLAAP